MADPLDTLERMRAEKQKRKEALRARILEEEPALVALIDEARELGIGIKDFTYTPYEKSGEHDAQPD